LSWVKAFSRTIYWAGRSDNGKAVSRWDKRQVQLYESDMLTEREASTMVDSITQPSCI